MTSDRSSVIKIGDKEYTLTLTTRATKEIAKKYGGLENLGDKLMKSENFEMAIGEIIWLLTLLANQSLLIHNLKNPKDKNKFIIDRESSYIVKKIFNMILLGKSRKEIAEHLNSKNVLTPSLYKLIKEKNNNE